MNWLQGKILDWLGVSSTIGKLESRANDASSVIATLFLKVDVCEGLARAHAERIANLEHFVSKPKRIRAGK